MKNIIALILLISTFSTLKAQDFIYMKDGAKYDVKILKSDKASILFYLNSDSSKSVKKVSRSVIDKFEYNSTNTKADSVLLSNYNSIVETNILNSGVTQDELDRQKDVDLKSINPAVKHFSAAKNQFVVALVCIAASSAISTIALSTNMPSDPLDPKYLNKVKSYQNKIQAIQYTQYGVLALSTAFTVSSAINIFDGLIELAKLKQ